jgi:hypothetical protein
VLHKEAASATVLTLVYVVLYVVGSARSLGVMGSAAGGSALVLTGLVVSAQKFEVAWGTLIAIATGGS